MKAIANGVTLTQVAESLRSIAESLERAYSLDEGLIKDARNKLRAISFGLEAFDLVAARDAVALKRILAFIDRHPSECNDWVSSQDEAVLRGIIDG